VSDHLAIHPNKNLILTGGMDHSVILFNKDTDTILATLTGHKKAVTSVAFQNERLLSSSDDNTTRLWDFNSKSGQYTTSATVKHHQSQITGMTCHPGGSFFVTTSRDKSWACFNMEGELVLNVDGEQEYTCGSFHPDGVILGTAMADNTIPLWDVTSNSVVATFAGHQDEVTSLSFSENGYYLASGSRDGTCRLWDLRKQTNIHTIEVGSAVNSVQFDYSGNYLAVGGKHVQVFQGKTWQELFTGSDHSKDVTGVAFGKDAHYLASVSMDRHLNIWSSKK
jgi:pre-mRNA-processing factor 19